MAPTSIAEAEDLDLDGQGQGDDGELRRPLGEWLTVRAPIGDAAPIVPSSPPSPSLRRTPHLTMNPPMPEGRGVVCCPEGWWSWS